jgi:flavin reductase (DIM6/NTAB) family NADH-FMN oxidoreductase RutF
MHHDIAQLEPLQIYKMLVGGIIPRPIAWISTLSAQGIDNIAPYSFFSVASVNPPVLTITHVMPQTQQEKDTLRNLKETGEAVVNIVSAEMADKMNASCAALPPETSEFTAADIPACDSEKVRAKSVANAPVRYECKLRELLPISDQPTGGTLILLDVVNIFIDDAIVQDGMIQADQLDAIGKLGGDLYSTTRDRFALKRP